jgi:hypothetical protein
MSTLFAPKIAEGHYPLFVALSKSDFPETFKMWEGMQFRRNLEHEIKFTPPGEIREIEVNPREFSRYCRANGSDCTLQALYRLVAEKGGRESK